MTVNEPALCDSTQLISASSLRTSQINLYETVNAASRIALDSKIGAYFILGHQTLQERILHVTETEHGLIEPQQMLNVTITPSELGHRAVELTAIDQPALIQCR